MGFDQLQLNFEAEANMDPVTDLKLVAESIRKAMAGVASLEQIRDISGLSEKLAPLAAQIEEAVKSGFAAAPPVVAAAITEPSAGTAAPPPEAALEKPRAEPHPVAAQAFAAENSPPPEDIRAVIARLLSTTSPLPERPMAESGDSVWKMESEGFSSASDAGPDPATPVQPQTPPPKSPRRAQGKGRAAWEDLSELEP